MKLLITTIAGLSLHFLSAAAGASTMQEALQEYGIKVDPAHLGRVTKDQHLKGTTKSQHLIEAETPEHEHFEVKVIGPLDQAAAQSLIETESTAIKKLFAATQTPYMGDIAQAIGGCPSKFGPLEKNVSIVNKNVKALLGAANAKRGFGACSNDDAKFKGAFVAYYDEASQSVWTWRVFVPWADGAAPLKSDWLKSVLSRFNK